MSLQNLKYGHIIRIRSNDKGTHSYITSKSYTDPKLYFQTYGYQDNQSKFDVSNYRQSLFEILPTSSFQVNDEINQIKNEVKRSQSLHRAKTQQDQFKALIQEKKGKPIFFGDKVVFRHLDSKHFIYGTQQCAQSGTGAFKIILSQELSEKLIFQLHPFRTYQKNGEEININAPVKIYHPKSQCFLSFEIQQIFMDIVSQKPSQPIRKQIPELQLRLFHTVKRDQKQIQKQKLPNYCSRYQIISQNYVQRIWQFQRYLDAQLKASKQVIRNHDIVYLLHTKDGKYLFPDNFSDIVLLNKRIGATDPEYIFDGLWQIQQRTEVTQQADAGGLNRSRMPSKRPANFLTATYNPTLSMKMSFRRPTLPIKRQDQKQSQPKRKLIYSLRHLMSGRVLYFIQQRTGKFKIILKHYDDKLQQDKQGFVLLQCFDSILSDGILTRLNIDNGKAYLQVKPKQQVVHKQSIKNIVNGEESPKCLASVSDREKKSSQSKIQSAYQSNFQKEELQPTKDANQHGFRIYKVNQKIKKIALKIISSQEILYKFIHFISIGKVDSRQTTTMNLLNNVMNVMKDLIGFIFNCDYNTIISSGNRPNSLRQRAFDQLGMVQLITSLLNQIQLKDKILLSQPLEYKKIRSIYVLGYEMLQSMAAYSTVLKIKISKYLHIYLEHLLEPHNRVVYKSIEEILDGNQLALQQKVKLQYIKNLIGTFGDSTKDPSNLQFLSKLCLCNNRTVKKNQDAVFKAFYGSSENKNSKFQFKEDHGNYQVSSKVSQDQDTRFWTLTQLYQQCQLIQSDGVFDHSKGHWNYFMQYLNLLADVCVNRNSTPLDYISKNLPLKMLGKFLQQKLTRSRLLHQPFVRLVHHAYVQTQQYKQISRITKVKDWNTLGDQSEIPGPSSPVSPQLKSIMHLVIQYIAKINLLPWQQSDINTTSDAQPKSIVFNPQDMSSLNNINTFLQLLRSTLQLGFWPSMSDIRKMVPCILKILAFDTQYAEKMAKNSKRPHTSDIDLKAKVFSDVKQQLRLNKPNIVLLVQCKILAAQILDIIIDYQFNIRASSITSHFRKVLQQDVDLRNYPYDGDVFRRKWVQCKEFGLFAPANQKEGYLLNEQLWIDQINATIGKGDLFSICRDQNVNFLLVLFETFIYANQQLTDLVLKVLIRVTTQRKRLLNTFQDIILVSGGNLKKLTDRFLKTRSSLLKLTNQQVLNQPWGSTNLWNKCNDSPNDLFQKKQLGTIQQLAFLTMAMKKGQNPTQAKASKAYELTDLYPFKKNFQQEWKDRSYLIITQKQENNPLSQNLIKKQQHHLLILNFIRIMQKIQKQNQQFPMLALHASYNFLTVLVWNNIQNKNQLQSFLIQAQQHLGINIGCVDFFQQMYRNNKKLVVKTDVSKIVSKIIQLANKLDINQSYHKSKLLDFLRNIIIFDNKGVTKNQSIVMEKISQFQVSDNNQIVYFKVRQGISITIQDNCEKWMKEYAKDYSQTLVTYKDLHISPQLCYVATFFQIFSGLIENSNKVNIGKCTNMHPHSFLVTSIRKYQSCWPVVRHLRSYINKLYYLNQQKQSQLFIDFLRTDLHNIESEIKEIIILIANAPDYNTIRIKNPIRYAYLGSYVLVTLEECLHSLDLMFSYKKFDRFLAIQLGQQNDQTQKNYSTLLSLMKMISYLMQTINGRYINRYLAKVGKHIRRIVSQIPLKIIQKYMQQQKKQIQQNLIKNNLTIQQDLFVAKNYSFHNGKKFWRHLLDWNAHFEQQQQRVKNIKTFCNQTAILKQKGQLPDFQGKKKRQYFLQKISINNIKKLILFKQPQRRNDKEKSKENQNQQQQIKMGQKTTQDILPQNLIVSFSQRFKVKTQRFQNPQIKNLVINSRRRKLVQFIQVNSAFTDFSHQQTQQKLYNGFSQLNSMSIQKYGFQVVGKSDVLRTVIQMNKKDSKAIKLQFKVQITKVLTALIQKQSPIFQRTIEKWVITDQNQHSNIMDVQNFLNDCNCSQFLCSLIQNDMGSSLQFSNDILLFGICLLIGKNENAQKKVLEILKRDQKNVVLLQLKQLIKKNQLNSQLFNFATKSSQFNSSNYSDTYDFNNDNECIMQRKFTYIPQTALQQKQFQQKMILLQRIFIFFKVFCQGSSQQIKNYIRQQTTNDQQKKIKTESINFIELSTTELKRLFADFKVAIINVPLAIANFIYEVTQIPCVNNQLFLCTSTSYFHDFAQLQKNISTKISQKSIQGEDIKTLNDFFAMNIKNCISCLQGNHQKIRASLITDDLCSYYVDTFALFINYMSKDEYWRFTNQLQLSKQMDQKKIFQGQILNLFDVTTVIVKLKKIYKQFGENIKAHLCKAQMGKYFQCFQNSLLGIQIKMDGGQADNDLLQFQYFPRHSVYSYLSRATRQIIMQQINRSTQRDKIIGLIGTTQAISHQINYNFVFDHQYKILGFPVSIAATKIGTYQSISLALSMLICLFIMIFANVIYYPRDRQIQYNLGDYKVSIQIVSYIQFAFALTYTTLWMINHTKLASAKHQLTKHQNIKVKVCRKGRRSRWPFKIKKLFKIPGMKSMYCLLKYDSEVWGILLFMLGSALGTLYSHQWFATQIFHFMMARMDALKNMVASITTKIKILIMLSLLGGTFIGIFSIFSINYYVPSLYHSKLPKNHCMTVFDCIAEMYIKEEIGSEMDFFHAGRFAANTIYYIFMTLLFSNIVSGVLIDTFTELRERKQQIRKDKDGMCFICGITKQILQKRSENIKTHYRSQYHKLWDYVFYIYHLNLKKQKVGLQYIINQKVQNQDVSWLPVQGADGKGIRQNIQQLDKAINDHKKLIDQIQ